MFTCIKKGPPQLTELTYLFLCIVCFLLQSNNYYLFDSLTSVFVHNKLFVIHTRYKRAIVPRPILPWHFHFIQRQNDFSAPSLQKAVASMSHGPFGFP